MLIRFVLPCFALLIATGCYLPRQANDLTFADLTPRNYCPGDVLMGSYNFESQHRCTASTETCTAYAPTVTFTSETGLFAPVIFSSSYAGSFVFPAPSADSVTIMATVDRSSVTIPTNERDSEGRAIAYVNSGYVNPSPETARLYNPADEQSVRNSGDCRNQYTPIQTRGAPGYSPRLVVNQLCNRDSVPVAFGNVDASGPGSWEITVMPGRCEPLPPGVSGRLTQIGYRPMATDLGGRCMGGTTADISARPLNVGIQYRCGP
jgi:hypothetical protein